MRADTTVILSEMAERLTHEFGLDPAIAPTTPYDWWKRSKTDKIVLRMPPPIRNVGRSPVFLMRDINRWYRAYKQLGGE